MVLTDYKNYWLNIFLFYYLYLEVHFSSSTLKKIDFILYLYHEVYFGFSTLKRPVSPLISQNIIMLVLFVRCVSETKKKKTLGNNQTLMCIKYTLR